MAETTQKRTEVEKMTTYKQTFEKRGGWLISWWKKVKTETIGEDLVINTSQIFDHVYLNGKEYMPIPDKGNKHE